MSVGPQRTYIYPRGPSTQVADVQAAGGIAPSVHPSIPTASVDTRGVVMRTEGGTGVADTLAIPLKNVADGYTNYYPMMSTSGNLSSVGQVRTVVDTGGVYATPIVLTAADSGKIYLLDDAAGLDFTLPAIAAADVGIQYTFFLTVQVTSNAYRFTAQSGDLFRGHVLISDVDAAYTAPQILVAEADESNDVIMTMALIASGGGKGGWFELTAITATGWFVRGMLIGDGTIVTVFS